MKPQPPGLESRRAPDFERELVTRARTWIPSWSLDEAEADFGLALLKIAARFSSEVAERLDGAGSKMALGFLDWLGLQAGAARPARMPVVMNLAETAKEPVFALRPAKMQVDVADTTVTFETESDLQIIPGQLAAVVGVDPAKDAYYLPPPGLTNLAELEPLPTEWKLKNFTGPGSKTVQLDPGLGMSPGMLLEIAGEQYGIVEAKDDLVTLDNPVPTGDGWPQGTRVTKVDAFYPFDGARNLQEHILYIGDAELLNIEADARIEVSGLGTVPDSVEWEYWGKHEPENPSDADARWRALTAEQSPPPTPDSLVLSKPKGSVETNDKDGLPESRWIRARLITSTEPMTSDSIRLRINPASGGVPAELTAPDGAAVLPPVDIFVNATPSTANDVFLFGQEPRLLDTLYIGCPEAFSKGDATAWISFELSDGAFEAMTAFDRGSFFGGPMLAAVDKGGALNLLRFDQNNKLVPFNRGRPLKPEPKDATDSAGVSNFSLTSWDIRPAVWIENTDLCIAVASKGDIWVRKEPIPQLLPNLQPFGLNLLQAGRWEYLGAPGDANSPIQGMALFTDGSRAIAVLTASGLFKRPTATVGPWTEIASADDVQAIATLRPDNPFTLAPEFLLVRKLADGTSELCTANPGGVATSRIQDVDPAVQPFGAVASGTTILAAATPEPATSLSVWKTGGITDSISIGAAKLSKTAIDGTISAGQATICCAASEASRPLLLRWLPLHAQFGNFLFKSEIDLLRDIPKGVVSSLPDRVFLPGHRKGEVISATFAIPAQFAADPGMFHSAVVIRPPFVPSTDTETVAVKVGTALKQADVEGTRTEGIGTYAGSIVLWLDGLIDRSNAEVDAFLFLSSGVSPVLTGDIDATDLDVLENLSQPLEEGDALLVRSPGGNEDLVEVIDLLNAAGDRVQVKPAINAALGDPISYRVANKVKASFHPSLKLDGTNGNNVWDTRQAVAGGLYFDSLDPKRQGVIAYVNDQGTPPRPQYLAFENRWINGPSPGPSIAFVLSNLSEWTQVRASPAATAELAWEYWNGTGWWHLQIQDDPTSDLRQSGIVTFKVPADLKPTDWAGKTSYWIRARIIAGDYGQAEVSVIQEPVLNSNPPKTKQTVVRDPSNLQPPYALSVRVAYAANEASIPQYLLTKDSGSLRNQSEANRMAGARVEYFTPLSVALARLDAPAIAAETNSNGCVPDCNCPSGTASTSPQLRDVVAPTATEAPATGGRRALYLGFTSKLIGEPINLLVAVKAESDYDQFAPLGVDALIGDRFSPIVASDDTRALGETGLVKMAFERAPLKADLFGQALSWLRVAPGAGSEDWKPAISGIYPNAVWARSAETMTRELLGSSDGRPRLEVTLARPPLLRDTLELRVKEPLGDDERKAIIEKNPNLIKRGIADMPGDWVLWRQVPDPLDCEPNDRVYSLDERTGTVRFGDGRHGAIPPVGTDSIVAFAYERTEPDVEGMVAANFVGPRTELNLVSPIESVETVTSADQSAGGVAPEKPERVLEFAPAMLRHRDRAVSLRDFEDLVRQRYSEVVQARAFNHNGRVQLIVVTRGANPGPSRAQQREMRRMLLEIAPATLGARDALTIAGPRVRKLVIEVDLRVSALDDAGGVAKQTKERLVARFATDTGGEAGEGWRLGQSPSEDDVAEALLDIPELEGIASIKLFETNELGVEKPWLGDIASRDLVRLSGENIRIGFDIMEAAA